MRVRNRSLVLSIAWLTVALWAPPASAQEPATPPLQEVDLTLGGVLYGWVAEAGEAGDPVRLVVPSGDTIDIPAANVARIRAARGRIVGGRFEQADPNDTRLFFGPTGRTLPAGDAYLGVFELYLPFLAYGVTDRVTIAGGAPLLIGAGMPLVIYLAPKVQVVRSDALHASVGSLSFLIPDEGSFGVVYAVATAEGADGTGSLTAGAGWGYASGDVTDRPVIMAGGDLRISRSVKLLSENYFMPGESGGLLSAGVRFIGEHLSADVGLMMPTEGGFAFPLVNFVWAF